MSSYLTQVSTKLYHVSQSGTAVEITLPAGITLYGSSQPIRATLFQVGDTPIIIVVNGGTHDFWIDQNSVARPLQLAAPTGVPTLAAGAGAGLTGVYTAAVSFKVKDANGATLIESGLSPVGISAALVNQTLLVSNLPVSGDGTVNARGVYRSLTGGTLLYPWYDIDDNITLSDDRAALDAAISGFPAPVTRYNPPPDLKCITAWKNRLWGIPRTQFDLLRWTDEGNFYAWAADNEIVIPPRSYDSVGGTAVIPRRDQLGVCRKNKLYQITGNSNDDFQRSQVSETLGCVSQESVVVVRDVAYWLGERGIVEWSNQGIGYISEAMVDPWFITDTYFNRSTFSSVKGRYNADTDSVEWLLNAPDETTIWRWISYDIKARRWFGPHKTNGFTPQCVGQNSQMSGYLTNSTGLPLTVFGSADGYLYKRDYSNKDDQGVAVPFSITIPPIGGAVPLDADYRKVFLQPTIETRVESATAGNLTLTAIVGELENTVTQTRTHALSVARRRLPRLGEGRFAQITLTHSTLSEGLRLYALNIPVITVGRR